MTSISSTSILQTLLKKDTATSTTSEQSTPSILDAFAAVSGSNSDPTATGNTGNSYLLDLSPSAQAYLQNYSGSASNSSSSSSTGAGVVLTPQQQNKLNTILLKYKDAPYTDATFQKIQSDMAAAGIGADALAAQSHMRQLNTTAMLLNALGGGDGSVGTIGSSTDIATQTTEFMKKIAQSWTQISSTVGDAEE